ncbi:hypothetical protein FACS1894137_13470 [Spirochaetia bacterium]|nr:hypothetical protein FACS1894137_13470 [Spirochaetia bacterium]
MTDAEAAEKVYGIIEKNRFITEDRIACKWPFSFMQKAKKRKKIRLAIDTLEREGRICGSPPNPTGANGYIVC